jgi:hypothetical protein
MTTLVYSPPVGFKRSRAEVHRATCARLVNAAQMRQLADMPDVLVAVAVPATCCRVAAVRDAIAAAAARADAAQPASHELVVFNAVDVPQDVQSAVMALLTSYSPDVYTRECDATGRAL